MVSTKIYRRVWRFLLPYFDWNFSSGRDSAPTLHRPLDAGFIIGTTEIRYICIQIPRATALDKADTSSPNTRQGHRLRTFAHRPARPCASDSRRRAGSHAAARRYPMRHPCLVSTFRSGSRPRLMRFSFGIRSNLFTYTGVFLFGFSYHCVFASGFIHRFGEPVFSRHFRFFSSYNPLHLFAPPEWTRRHRALALVLGKA